MANYEKPPINKIPFTFTTGGYTGPDFTNVPFRFGLRPTAQQTADLQAAINVMGIYQTETYSYLKSCPTIVIGYVGGIPQILQLPCIYGGIRDIGSYIYGNPHHADLGATIRPVFGQAELPAYIKSTVQAYRNLGASAYGIPPSDLIGYIKSFVTDTKDLGAFAYGIPPVDLPAEINPELLKGLRNLPSNVYGIPPVDLLALIYGFPPVDLPAYIKAWHILDLQGQINTVYKSDLPALILALQTGNLPANIFGIAPVDLPAFLVGWAEKDLPAAAAGVYGPHDLQASIVGSGGYRALYGYIRGMLGVEIPYNLPAVLVGTFAADLPASIGFISPADLKAIINATGQAEDLPATIVPKVIYMTQVLQVALLEHKNLRAMINSACFSSDSLNLSAYIRSIYKRDLQGIIFGWNVDIYSNVKDLTVFINTGDFYVQDKMAPWFFPEDKNVQHTRLKISFSATKSEYTVFDTQRIFFGAAIYLNLGATITGILHSADLGATLRAVFDFNFTELPYYVSPRTREMVIDFDHNWRENWRRFAEIFFNDGGTTPYHYFYVAGTNRVYRVDRNRHWTIWAKGFDETDTMIERVNVRQKFIFKAYQYATVDEAVRDLIDRVTDYRKANLMAQIYGELPIHVNLGAIITPDIKYTWVKHLRATIIPDGFFDLGASITGIT